MFSIITMQPESTKMAKTTQNQEAKTRSNRRQKGDGGTGPEGANVAHVQQPSDACPAQDSEATQPSNANKGPRGAQREGEAGDHLSHVANDAGTAPVVATRATGGTPPAAGGTPRLAPVGERIDAAYVQSLKSAMDAVCWAIEAGNLLVAQHEKTPKGQWDKWLEVNCKKVHRVTAWRLMKAATYADGTGYLEAQSVRQLYLEAGAIKPSQEDAGPKPEKCILLPIIKAFKKVRLCYTDAKLDKLKPVAMPQLLGYVRDIKKDLGSLEERLLKRMQKDGSMDAK
jgi:hypothetical protein